MEVVSQLSVLDDHVDNIHIKNFLKNFDSCFSLAFAYYIFFPCIHIVLGWGLVSIGIVSLGTVLRPY